jgi:membrane-bound metal-dependent hydrolase YbcI (DUF457 family)
LGYLSGKATSKLTKTNVNLPLLFFLSVIPDIDLLIPGLEHRGPTHSLIVFCLLFLPIFKLYGTRVLPYLIPLASHTLADGLTGGAQALWPINTNLYGTGICIKSLTNIYAEWTLFLASLTLLLTTKELWKLLKPHPSNLLLAIPIISIFDSTFLGFPIPVPTQLIIPHLIKLTIFTLSILTDLRHISKKT